MALDSKSGNTILRLWLLLHRVLRLPTPWSGVSPAEAIAALSAFGGVKRRMEVRGKARGVTVYDDFAHHPSAIRATLDGLRQRVGGARILAVLEPRSNTMKLGVMKDALAPSLAAADAVYVYDAQLGWDAAEALRPLGGRAHCVSSLDALIEILAEAVRDGDHVVIMSNGGFGGLHGRLLQRLGRSG